METTFRVVNNSRSDALYYVIRIKIKRDARAPDVRSRSSKDGGKIIQINARTKEPSRRDVKEKERRKGINT